MTTDTAGSMPRPRYATLAAVVAALLGLGSAGISAYWASGGTGLLDTVGGDIERWGRQRDGSVVAALWAVAVLKAGVALAAPAVVGMPPSLPPWTRGRVARILSWIAACVLAAYGALLTIPGLLVQTSVLDMGPASDPKALAWHAYLWDPWFLVWGLAFIVCLWLTRRPRRRTGSPGAPR